MDTPTVTNSVTITVGNDLILANLQAAVQIYAANLSIYGTMLKTMEQVHEELGVLLKPVNRGIEGVQSRARLNASRT